ncbi:hypothetical protein CYMTET_19071 [Cymbomonas tetramitiformis]|uniref:Aminopeptidase P N-terminal domain-containing protein n=1 Tax=Cymbomonas tetramitiformis TaxID=36881 RepID=A0AAE0G6R7_9CHLO|nr:hypothetical protein CYMTET_19071 [Cymbomonas tetramitiformis]
MRRVSALLRGQAFLSPSAFSVTNRSFFNLTAAQPSGRPATESGQPTPISHPSLLKAGEIMPGISSAEFEKRRTALAQHIPPGGAALLSSAEMKYMAGVIPYPYRQDSDYLYLTGITQPGTATLLERSGDGKQYTYSLFVPEADAHAEQWNGWMLDKASAEEVFGAHQVFTMGELGSELRKCLGRMSASEGARLLFHKGLEGTPDARAALAASNAPLAPNALRPVMHHLRWRKSPAEVEVMRRSAELSAAAMSRCMAESHGGVEENTLASIFEYDTRRGGAQRMAYPQVVAGGASANIIHYSRNDKAVLDGEMVLMDAGCEYYGYASDITRTWPVNGRFTSAQREVYEAVLDVHRQCLEASVEGGTLRELHYLSVRTLSEALRQFGLPHSGSSYRRFYPHNLGHWLGLDTHDVAHVSLDRPMEPGVVLTVEPGLYIPDADDIPKGLRGIGVRLEDDIVVTGKGPADVLTKNVPLDPEDVEALVGSVMPP